VQSSATFHADADPDPHPDLVAAFAGEIRADHARGKLSAT
jgi:hypothetical protein